MKKINSIVIIGNNEIDKFIHEKLLQNCGAENILYFADAISSLSYLQRQKVQPDIILIDLYMSPIDGIQFIDSYKHLRATNILTQLFILSASINPEDKKTAMRKGAGFIEKPLTREKLSELLDTCTTCSILNHSS